ncbi:glucosaminidase domain-containing protein [Enterococcus gilvus]|uniref:glucosaminidase domain-containing protein n=1 Tax=Enterococcus gilvus TaxID=160453 RepID=UPI00345EE737
MNEKYMYQQDELIVFRSAERKNRNSLNKGVIGTTAIFGSLSMVLSVVPIQTMASEKPTVVVPAEHQVAPTTPSEQQVKEETTVIADPTFPATTEMTETTTNESMTETSTSGSTNKSTTETSTSGSTNESTTETSTSGSTNESTTETSTSGSTNESTTETSTSGSTNESTTETSTSGSTNESTTETTTSGSTNESHTETSTSESKKDNAKTVPLTTNNGPAVANEAPSKASAEPLARVDFSDQWSSAFTAGSPTDSGAISYLKNQTTEEFIKQIAESARKVGQEKELYASVMIAQAILESGSGSSSLSQEPHHNLFGIKGEYKGNSVSFDTQEDDGAGHLSTISANFRSYDRYEDSFNDYAELMKNGISGNPTFYEGVWKTTASTYEEATAFLTGKYATDTHYDQKLNGLIETYDLTEYDHPKRETTSSEATNGVSATGYMVPVANYTISSGFGSRGGEFHRGLDLAAPAGEAISAAKAGKVLTAEAHPSWGNYVVLLHSDGTTTLYAHLSAIKAQVGQEVTQGQVIGLVGSTGNSTGPHLHLEICSDASLAQSKLVDPQTILFG